MAGSIRASIYPENEMSMAPLSIPTVSDETLAEAQPAGRWTLALRNRRVAVGGGILLSIMFICIFTLGWSSGGASPLFSTTTMAAREAPSTKSVADWFGRDALGRSLLARCLLGGTISLAVGLAAATISVVLGVSVGLVAGYRGGWIDSVLMRLVDILYGLPYVLLVILFKIGFEEQLSKFFDYLNFSKHLPISPKQTANLVVLFAAIGMVSWLTMARVVRGQVLSLRSQPFVEACKAMGIGEVRIFLRHILPNLVGPITVYATLTVPSAILQESFLSFLGVGVSQPLPTWGSLASEAIKVLSPLKVYWWMLTYPCLLLVVTLLSLNFLGDGLRDVFDPKRDAAKI
jgi:ABC-type dipeptide/oligopeptide/nickel transport system permease subunit